MSGYPIVKSLRRWAAVWGLFLVGLACNLPLAPLDTSQTLPTQIMPAQPATQAMTLQASFTPEVKATPAPTQGYQVVFEDASCAFVVPGGYEPRCGYLVVPENRARSDSPRIRLHVAVFHSSAENPAVDPVVFLSGGPGSSALDLVGYLFRRGVDAVLERSDLILFDQRGTGYSQPRLDCPERQELVADLLAHGLIAGDAGQQIEDAFLGCRDRLRGEGIDLEAYTSAASAADVNDLRLALGYQQINLYGVSYGTRLGLTLMRDYPTALRSAVLDSVYPPQENLYIGLAPNAERSFNLLFERCSADPDCSVQYPDLRGVFYSLVDQLNASPVEVTVNDSGVERTARLDGGLLIDVLFVGMYNPLVTARMPEMIYAIRQGEYGLLRERLSLYFDPSTALGMNMAVQCAEEIPFSQAEDVYAAAETVQAQIAAFFPASVAPLYNVCQTWHPDPPDPRENQPVRSDVPALLLSGELDPITPPEWARETAAGLGNSYFYVIPGNGHWVTRSSTCALQMALAFWRDPSRAPDIVCE
jgi:pimeloyl-ACP methyl ester carboxylesterase